ncbi:response regulator, partial [Rhodopseudomonas sp. BR0C11]
GRPLRVLIAEDDATNQMVVMKMLQEFAAEITVVSDGTDAVTAAGEGEFDVVLMDVRMPNMDGLAATRAIRGKGGALAKLPIIALTANAFPDDVKVCRDAGMNDFLSKPLRKPALVAAVLRALRGASTPVTMPSPPMQVDMDTLAELTAEIGQDQVSEMVALFFAETERRIALFRRFAEQMDRHTIEVEAHSLKGGARTLGFHPIAEIARSIERDAKTISPEGLDLLTGQLNKALIELRRQCEGSLKLAS